MCVSLWPVQIAASKLFMHTFYAALLSGTKASVALTEAMKNLQTSKHFSHPSNWAGEQEEPKEQKTAPKNTKNFTQEQFYGVNFVPLFCKLRKISETEIEKKNERMEKLLKNDFSFSSYLSVMKKGL